MANTPEKGSNKSSDWAKYSSATETRLRLAKQQNKAGKFKNPKAFFVYSHSAEQWRESDDQIAQKVTHDPIQANNAVLGVPENRSHSIIIGEKTTQIRALMARRAQWEINPPDSKSKMKDYRNSLEQ